MSDSNFRSGKRRINAPRERGQYEVIGEDPHQPGLWMVRRPDGLECSGRWLSEQEAKKDCDKWNALSASLLAA